MMPVVSIGRREPIEQPVEVADGARLEFDRGDSGRGSDHEHRDDPLADTAILNRSGDRPGNVVRVPLPAGADGEFVSAYHGLLE
jgi:hypothetical protein